MERNKRSSKGSVGKVDTSESIVKMDWSSLIVDVQDMILSKLSYDELFRLKSVSKWFRDHIDSDEFRNFRGVFRPKEGSLLTALHFSIGTAHGVLHCCGYDLTSKSWKMLPPFEMLPRVHSGGDPHKTKGYLICGAGGIMCASVSSSTSLLEKIIVFNPLSGRWRELPPLNYPRNPVLIHMVMDSSGESYKIVVAGASNTADRIYSKITEVFDSCSSMWTVAQDLPGPFFALNEHQTGVYLNGILYCIAFMEVCRRSKVIGRGMVAFSVDEGKWLPHRSCLLPNPTLILDIVHLVGIDGEIVLFESHEERNWVVALSRTYKFDGMISFSGVNRGLWKNVTSATSSQSRNREDRCVPFGEGKLCLFNETSHKGVVCDIQSGNSIGILSSPTWRSRQFLCTLNPLTFTCELSFKSNPNIWFQRAP